MIRRIAISAVCGVLAYFAGAALGIFLVSEFSANMHDRELEAAMTGVFVAGPVSALLGLIGGWIWSGRHSPTRKEIASLPSDES